MKLPYAINAANLKKSLALLVVTLLFAISIAAQTTAFTYQGKLTDSGNPANGNYDFQFRLFNAVSGGTLLGSPVVLTNVAVSNGSFTVTLDFGACPTCFDGTARFLEIAVKPTSGSTFTNLSPRQQVNSTPYAIKSLNAANATTADGLSVACVNCVTSSQIASVNGSAVTGTIPVASVPSGSTNYIQNTITQQATSNFNISGNGIIGGNLGIGTTSPTARLNVVGGGFPNNLRVSDSNTTATAIDLSNTSAGGHPWRIQSVGGGVPGRVGNLEIWEASTALDPAIAIQPGGNVGIGTTAPTDRLQVDLGNILVRGVNNFASNGDTAIVYLGDQNHSIRSVRGSGVSIATFGVGEAITLQQSSGNVGIGTTAPARLLHVAGRVRFGAFPLEGSVGQVCYTLNGDLVDCSASSLRFKTNVQPFADGLNILRRLRPISFDWKEGGAHDIGLAAEDVAEVAPFFTVKDEQGKVSGVKYERLNMVLLNGIKELAVENDALKAKVRQLSEQQRTQQAAQQAQFQRQQQQIEALTKLICSTHPKAAGCKSRRRR